MKNIFLIFFCFLVFLKAEDPVISVTNENSVLPKIILKDDSKIEDEALRKSFYNMILNDLKVSSNFDVVQEGDQNSNYTFAYSLYKKNNNLYLDVKIKAGKTDKPEKSYFVNSVEEYPFLAHKSVKESMNLLSLSPVDWMDHKILISRVSGLKKSQIIIADYTLTYQKVIINNGLNLFPKWANVEQSEFYYTAYELDKPSIFKYNFKTNKSDKIFSSDGMVVVSDVSHDGNKLLVTMAPEDQPDVYLYDLTTKNFRKITNYSGIDVNGNFIGVNQDKIVFVSDRLGYPNVFVQDLNSNTAEQATFYGKNNSSVSTYKDFLVYSSREPNQFGVFNIYLMSINNDHIRQLTANGKNIFPRFSSDGGSVIFIKYLGSQSALGVIRVNANKSFYYPLKIGKIQSIDW